MFRKFAAQWSGRAMIGLVLLGLAWPWWGTPPPLANTNAPDQGLNDARSAADAVADEREAAVVQAAILDGARGDFERRGTALRELDPPARSAETAALAADAGLLAAVVRTAAAERDALARYDTALMARTRDLGPRAEGLRSATWPIVEHLKLYPPPLGTRTDFHPPDAAFFADRAAIFATDDVTAQTEAAIEIGRSTYDLRLLRELDATYRAELDRYAATLQTTIATSETGPSTLRHVIAAVLALGLALLLLAGITGLSDGCPAWAWLLGGVALAGWYVLPLPWAWLSAAGLVAALAWRPALMALLPLAALPWYYRPRVVGSLSFPLNETLCGWIALALALRGGWALAHGWRPRFDGRGWWRSFKIPLLLIGGLVLAGGIGLLYAPLVEPRIALRELRRTLVEPGLWALLVLVLLRRGTITARQLIWGLILPAAWIASDGLVRFALGEGIWATAGVPRLIGVLPSSTALGVYLAAATASVLALAWAVSDSADRRAARLLCLPLMMGVLLTFTRGAWLGVTVALIVVWCVGRRWRILGGVVVGGLVLGGVALLLQPDLVGRVLRLREGTGSARTEIWTAAGRAIGDSPWFGLGLDQFAHVDPTRYGIPQIRFLTLAHPHNLVLDVWLQLGLLGVGVVGMLVGWAAWRLWRARANAVALATLALLVALLVHGMLDQTMLGGDMIYGWMLVCVLTWQQATIER